MFRSRKPKLSPDELREKQEKYNASISSSLAGILRFSLDSKFRSKCFDLMKVDNTNDLQAAIKRHLDILSNLRARSPSINLEEPEAISNKNDRPNEPVSMVLSEEQPGGSEKDKDNAQTEINHNAEDLENDEFWPGTECFEWITLKSEKSVEISAITNATKDDKENEEFWLENDYFQWETSNTGGHEKNEDAHPESLRNADEMNDAEEVLLKDVLWE